MIVDDRYWRLRFACSGGDPDDTGLSEREFDRHVERVHAVTGVARVLGPVAWRMLPQVDEPRDAA